MCTIRTCLERVFLLRARRYVTHFPVYFANNFAFVLALPGSRSKTNDIHKWLSGWISRKCNFKTFPMGTRIAFQWDTVQSRNQNSQDIHPERSKFRWKSRNRTQLIQNRSNVYKTRRKFWVHGRSRASNQTVPQLHTLIAIILQILNLVLRSYGWKQTQLLAQRDP